jgi:hypothetical protein
MFFERIGRKAGIKMDWAKNKAKECVAEECGEEFAFLFPCQTLLCHSDSARQIVLIGRF